MAPDHTPPSTPLEWVAQMRESAKDFLAACEALTPEKAREPGVCGVWSAKAVVDHITGWQVQSLPILKKLRTSNNEAFDLDIDGFNRISVEAREELTWEESLEAFRESYSAFDQAAVDISLAHFQGNEGFKSWVKAMIHEYKFHLPQIELALRRK